MVRVLFKCPYKYNSLKSEIDLAVVRSIPPCPNAARLEADALGKCRRRLSGHGFFQSSRYSWAFCRKRRDVGASNSALSVHLCSQPRHIFSSLVQSHIGNIRTFEGSLS